MALAGRGAGNGHCLGLMLVDLLLAIIP